MAVVYIWILLVAVVANAANGFHQSLEFRPCRTDRTTLCPPGFLCSETTDGILECHPTSSEKECFDVGFAHLYKGYAYKTVKGKYCQLWSSTTPHKPSSYIKANDFPDDTIEDAENYCRDPLKNGRPWCYTTDPDERWDYCDVVECLERDCYKEGYISQYKGFTNVTKKGVPCQRWDANKPHKPMAKYKNPDLFPDISIQAANNYCRGLNDYKPWCYTTGSTRWDYCDVKPCSFDFCYDKESWQYYGLVTTTTSGLTCQRWDQTYPHKHDYGGMPHKFPDASVYDAHNYCRDPSWYGKPWCYTTNPDKRWEVCNIKRCKDI